MASCLHCSLHCRKLRPRRFEMSASASFQRISSMHARPFSFLRAAGVDTSRYIPTNGQTDDAGGSGARADSHAGHWEYLVAAPHGVLITHGTRSEAHTPPGVGVVILRWPAIKSTIGPMLWKASPSYSTLLQTPEVDSELSEEHRSPSVSRMGGFLANEASE